jgi:tetratricopeptide (TPR) repeat protein
MLMSRVKDIFLGILVVAILGSLVIFVFRNNKNKKHGDLARQIAELSPRGGPPETIDGLRQAIALYDAQIELNVKEGAQTGAYWKILAIRLADRNMHRDALSALEMAIHYNSEDPFLYYMTGVSAGTVAKSIIGFSDGAAGEREQFYQLSEKAYLRALELDAVYTKPMYGLGILYAFELDRPADAVVRLERYLQLQNSDIQAMFVLARAYYMIENFGKAVELYDRIISRAKDQKTKTDAQALRDIVQGRIYG